MHEATHPAVPAPDATGGRPFYRSPFLWAFLVGIVSLTAIRPFLRHEPAPPPVLGQLPGYTLTAPEGRSFGAADLEGQVYVANFFFTRCRSICPRLTRAMATLQARYDEAGVDGVRLISITVDPEHDSPEILREYGVAHGVDPRRWTLLTGDRQSIRRLVTEGFMMSFGEPEELGPGLVDIAHYGKLVLVDPAGRIRGYYESDATGLDEVFHRSRHVLKEARRSSGL